MTRMDIVLTKDISESEINSMATQDKLAHALARIMRWKNPNGTIMEAYIPYWLANQGKRALAEYVSKEGSGS